MSKISNVLIFVSGAAIGSVVTWKLLETKYEQMVQEELESIKEAFNNEDIFSEEIAEDGTDARDKAEEAKAKPSVVEYASIIQKSGYHTDYSDISKKDTETPKVTEQEESASIDGPYVISPEEFGEFDDYREISLTYYADGVLTDECDNIIENAEEIVGCDSLESFGEYEEDAVHVRNDMLKCDYEILRSLDEYSDK